MRVSSCNLTIYILYTQKTQNYKKHHVCRIISIFKVNTMIFTTELDTIQPVFTNPATLLFVFSIFVISHQSYQHDDGTQIRPNRSEQFVDSHVPADSRRLLLQESL